MNEENVNAVVNQTGLKVACVGLGNAGGQVAIAAAQKGIDVFVINTSVKDLDDQVIGKKINAYQVGDGRGSGKNRDNAMALLMGKGNEGLRDLLTNPFFRSTVEGADVVFVTFSTAGGTGSGIGPKMAELIHKAYANKVVIPFGILPKTVESVMAQSNAIACVDDVTKLGTPYMLADLSYYESSSQEESFSKIGSYMAEVMCVIRGDYLRLSTNGMADERDVLTVISEPGYMTVHIKKGLTEVDLSSKTLQGYLIDEFKRSPACRIQRDGMLQYNLLVSNVSSSVQDPMKVGDYAELNAFIGEPKATYANYAVDESFTEFEVFSVTSGLTIPMDRFAPMKAKIKEHKDRYEISSKLNLAEDRSKLSVKGNDATQSIIMGSQQSSKADLSFLD